MASDAAVVKHPDEISRPVDAYMPTLEEMLDAVELKEREVNACLSAEGVDEQFHYPERTAVTAYLSTGIEDRRTRGDVWGFFSPETVRVHGYQRPGPLPQIEIAPLPQMGRESCGMLLPGEPDPLLLFAYGSLPGGGPPSVSEDPDVQRAVRGWSACMSAAGYSYELPTDPPLAFVDEVNPSERQKATAVADLRCKEETNLIALVLEKQHDQDQIYITKNASKLGTPQWWAGPGV